MKYRIPKIEEFVDGFEYQVAHNQKIDIVDFSKDTIIQEQGELQTIWCYKVYKQSDDARQPYTFFKDNEGGAYTLIRDVEEFENSLQTIEIMLKRGKIRTKIN